MYAVKQTYISHTHPEQNVTRLLKQRYKTFRGAENAAQRCRWVCMPDGDKGPIESESNAEVIPL